MIERRKGFGIAALQHAGGVVSVVLINFQISRRLKW
jgi:hypothetical protein